MPSNADVSGEFDVASTQSDSPHGTEESPAKVKEEKPVQRPPRKKPASKPADENAAGEPADPAEVLKVKQEAVKAQHFPVVVITAQNMEQEFERQNRHAAKCKLEAMAREHPEVRDLLARIEQLEAELKSILG